MAKVLKLGQFGHTFTRGIMHGKEYIKTVEQLTHVPNPKTEKLMSIISHYVMLPLFILHGIYCYKKHLEHEEHVRREGLPKFIHYPYLKIMNKPFPWGDGKHSLFHSKTNYVVGIGYEE
ncbi:Cytochrome c oxidase subunit 6A1, mitochondrial [Eufriesea mexicana]|uniref:Cytochrome c oxidase subunit 6A1, mitochondrial n=1 Tax=Eufriesea mexicana TaxID=516756 RepID=A0A310ST66_9HYME|nr:PREDICTED: cytochrome c oxidase subunit 6A1, mitochondrial-like [Eufriesea mexicana]OAD61365.1 Cytochrome c oxidase subunit 6A1, mitochondrial [Eufriesea mexicana]